ncbi:glycosyltransferase [Brachybacterium sp. AOP43-C2-M15]|uniref:glycosyltransferase n=1 Tax=Brachybacterium sp. AOP43-C2-M15 TaxID=3457661 RepID=UPI004034B546
MRVLVVPSWYPSPQEPLNGSFFREQARMVAEAGHEVMVLVPRTVPLARWRGASPVLEQDGALIVLRFSVPALPRPLQRLEQELMGHLAEQAHRSVGGELPDVIHAHSVMPGLLIAQDLAVRWGRGVVLTEHRPSSLTAPRSATRRAHLLHALADAAVVATVSEPFAAAIAEHYDIAPPEVIPLPVPERFFAPAAATAAAAELADPARPYTFLHVSNLVRNKRPEETLTAFARVAEEVEAHLVIAGGTPERARELRDRAASLGIAEQVEILGRVERDQLPALMARSHCLVLASALEAGGTVLGEARAAGLAVIATATWAGRAWVEPGSGTVVPVDDLAALGTAMTTAARDRRAALPEERDAIRERAREIFSADAFLQRQQDMYRRAVEAERGPRMLFHAPFPIDPRPQGASRLRPLRMLEAFAARGHRVHPLVGAPRQRAVAYRAARRRLRGGQDLELLYSENSTQPNLLATSVREGIAPLLDARILLWARRRGIPAGEFYRDVYWRFSTSLRAVRTPRSAVMNLLYRLDLAALRLARVHLFLPSERMAPIIPVAERRSSALPPGATVVESATPQGLHLLYVGGLGAEYGLDACVEAVSRTPGVTLTLCVPPAQWEKNRTRYEQHLGTRIRIVHGSGPQLEPLYDAASACVLFVEPGEYRTFAAPVKFFEYLGHGKPVLLSRGTHAGDLGERLGIGPVIDYSAEALQVELEDLRARPERLAEYAQAARRAREDQTWRARARQAAERLRALQG